MIDFSSGTPSQPKYQLLFLQKQNQIEDTWLDIKQGQSTSFNLISLLKLSHLIAQYPESQQVKQNRIKKSLSIFQQISYKIFEFIIWLNCIGKFRSDEDILQIFFNQGDQKHKEAQKVYEILIKLTEHIQKAKALHLKKERA